MHPGVGGGGRHLVNCPVAHSNAETPRNPCPLGLPGGIEESLSVPRGTQNGGFIFQKEGHIQPFVPYHLLLLDLRRWASKGQCPCIPKSDVATALASHGN